MIIILSAPSGCGKSTIADRLLQDDKNIILSISATTRSPRPGEIEGVHYFFKTKEEFRRLNLLEEAEIYGNYYGTPKEFVTQNLKNGKDILFDIDYQGAAQIMKQNEVKTVSIFILPPDIGTLQKRMEKRGQDSKESMEIRLSAAKNEMQYAQHYRYQIINDDFERAVENIQNIISSERDLKNI